MHYWGDEDVDWRGINDAAQYISAFCRLWGRLGGLSKEKYGTVRFYAGFGRLSLHALIYPAYVCSQFPAWLWRLDVRYIGPFMQYFLEKPFVKWQSLVYAKAYMNALKRWPHLRAEILIMADQVELIPGASRREGNELHILDAKGEIITTWMTI